MSGNGPMGVCAILVVAALIVVFGLPALVVWGLL